MKTISLCIMRSFFVSALFLATPAGHAIPSDVEAGEAPLLHTMFDTAFAAAYPSSRAVEPNLRNVTLTPTPYLILDPYTGEGPEVSRGMAVSLDF